MGISGQKRGIFGDFREKWRAETGKHRTSSMESSEVSATNIRCFMQRSPMFWGVPKGDFRCFHPLAPSIFSDMPQKNVHFHHTAMGKYTRNYQMNLRLQGLYGFGVSSKKTFTRITRLSGVAKKHSHGLHGVHGWRGGGQKKHSHGLHGLYSCRLPSGWVVTTTGTTRRIRPTPQDRNAPNGVYTASP